MKKALLALIACCVAVPAFADKPAPPPHKKHHKAVIVPPASPPVVVAPPAEEVPPPVVVVPPPVVVAPPPPAIVPPKKVCGLKPCPPEDKYLVPNLHLGIGVGAQSPWASGLAGVRLEFPVAYLALEPFISLPFYGFGVDGLIYAYRGPVVQFYPLSVGAMINWNHLDSNLGHLKPYLSDQDIDRVIDLRVGAGLQVKLACHVKLALDWRASIPDPVKLAREDGVCHSCGSNHAVALDASNAVKNAFAQSQLIVGVLIQ